MRNAWTALLCVGSALFFVSGSAEAQEMLRKKRPFTLKIPANLLDLDGRRLNQSPIFVAQITVTESGATVGSDSEWQAAGFPSLLGVAYEKTKYEKKEDHTEVEFRGERATLKLRFKGNLTGWDLEKAVKEVMVEGDADGAEAKTYLDQAYGVLIDKFFTGPLADLPDESKALLVRFAHITAGGTTISSTEYKENLYLVVDLGQDSSVYNSLKLNQAQRVAHVMNDKMLTILKAFAAPVKDAPEVYGLKLEYKIPHRPFTQETGSELDGLQFYATSERIREFADADITSQALIDASSVIVNDNRIEVSLSGS